MKKRIAVVNLWPESANAERENLERIRAAAAALGVETVSVNRWGSDLQTGKATIPIAEATTFPSSSFFALFRQNVLEGMLADPAYGGNRGMVGWKYVGFPGDPLRRGDVYHEYIFTEKPYPYANKPLPMNATYAKQAVSSAAGKTGSGVPADYPKK